MKTFLTRLCVLAGSTLVVALTAVAGWAAPAAAYTVTSVTPWMQNATPAAWGSNPDKIYYNSVGSNGYWNGYSANPDGSDAQCLTCTNPSFSSGPTNRGISDVSPNGQYMLVTVGRAGSGSAMGTQPGKGASNDVWLYTTDGQHAWPLTNIYAPGSFVLGSIWPRFDHTGNEIVWDSMTSISAGATINTWPLGVWEMQVANLTWSSGVPSLTNIQTINPTPGSFYEPYGFTPDNQHIIFATSNGGSWHDDMIDTIGVNGTGMTQLSPSEAAGVPNYAEFAFYTPGDDAIIWGRGYDTEALGMDYWIMGTNGSNPQRLTYFNEPWNTEYLGNAYVGGLAFNPENPNQFVADVSMDKESQTVDSVMITMNSSNTAGMMTEQSYATTNFQQLVSTSTYDLSDGFKAPASPSTGMPASNYSIRFSGAVTAPSSGTYSFCIAVENQAQVYVNGVEIVQTRFDFNKLQCGSVWLNSGQAVPVEVDYEHSTGSAQVQLSWITPGASSATIIPSVAISPLATGSITPFVGDDDTTSPSGGSGAAGSGSGSSGSPSGSSSPGSTGSSPGTATSGAASGSPSGGPAGSPAGSTAGTPPSTGTSGSTSSSGSAGTSSGGSATAHAAAAGAGSKAKARRRRRRRTRRHAKPAAHVPAKVHPKRV